LYQRIQRLIELPLPHKILFSVLNLSAFGFCLGSHSIITPQTSGFAQLITSVVKMPLLLMASTATSFFIVVLLNRLVGAGYPIAALMQAATSCLLFTSISLIPIGLIVLLLAVLENYSLIILTSYAGLSLAGLIGSGVFTYVLIVWYRSGQERQLFIIPIVWLICFGVTSAELGWKSRPLVGWSGQTFTLFRHDDTGMFQQLRCEVRNILNLGGIKFPKAGEESDTKDWPC
jgi:hypothetical protein